MFSIDIPIVIVFLPYTCLFKTSIIYKCFLINLKKEAETINVLCYLLNAYEIIR
jgi:hypothetical protein